MNGKKIGHYPGSGRIPAKGNRMRAIYAGSQVRICKNYPDNFYASVLIIQKIRSYDGRTHILPRRIFLKKMPGNMFPEEKSLN